MKSIFRALMAASLLSSGVFASTLPPKINETHPSDIIFDSRTFDTQVDRTYTTSTFHFPILCKDDNYSKICSFFENYYVSKFEHSYIGYITDNLHLEDEDSDVFIERDIAYQDVTFDLRVIKELGFMCVIALIKQEYQDSRATLTDVYNYNLKNNHLVHFSDLFENPEMAALICSNLIYEKFKKYNYKNLYVIKSQIEVDPHNFVLLPDGIEFIFTKGVIAPDEVSARLFISVDDLIDSKPKKEWFPSMDGHVLGKKIKRRGIKSKLLN